MGVRSLPLEGTSALDSVHCDAASDAFMRPGYLAAPFPDDETTSAVLPFVLGLVPLLGFDDGSGSFSLPDAPCSLPAFAAARISSRVRGILKVG